MKNTKKQHSIFPVWILIIVGILIGISILLPYSLDTIDNREFQSPCEPQNILDELYGICIPRGK